MSLRDTGILLPDFKWCQVCNSANPRGSRRAGPARALNEGVATQQILWSPRNSITRSNVPRQCLLSKPEPLTFSRNRIRVRQIPCNGIVRLLPGRCSGLLFVSCERPPRLSRKPRSMGVACQDSSTIAAETMLLRRIDGSSVPLHAPLPLDQLLQR